MMYRFKENIETNIHDEFVKNHYLCNLLQSSSWAKVKENWDHKIVGVYDEDTLIASALILIKQLPLGLTMMYAPRGPIMDYENERLVTFFFQELKKWAKKKKCLFVKCDPAIHIRDFKLEDKETTPYDEKATIIIANMKKANAIHKGYTTYIAETIQPRFHMGVKACDDMDAYVPRATYRSKNVAVRKHVSVERVGIDKIDDFSQIMHLTEERKAISLRNKEYFKQLMEIYPDNAYLFLAKVNPKDREKELLELIDTIETKLKEEEIGKKQLNKLNEELKQAKQELDSMQDILKKYDQETYIAGGLMIGFGKEMEMLYAGMNDDFRTFRPQYLTYMTQFAYAFDQGYEYVTMGGVEGTLEDGLSKYKLAFNPYVNEFIGEFDLPVNSLLYKASEFAYKLRKQKNIKK